MTHASFMGRDNPLRRLGLPASADERQIRARLDELGVQVDLGLGPAWASSAELVALREALADTRLRARARLYWVQSSAAWGEPPEGTTDARYFASCLGRLRDAPRAGRATREGLAQAHDRALLEYLRYLETPNTQDPGEALRGWVDVHESDEYWSAHAELLDPGLNAVDVETLRHELPNEVLAPLIVTAAAFVDTDQVVSAAEIVTAMRQSGLPSDATEAGVRAITVATQQSVREGVTRLREALELIPDDAEGTAETQQAIRRADSIFIGEVLAPMARLRTIDPLFEDSGLEDDVARAGRGLGVEAANEAGWWGRSALVLEDALACASSAHVRSQIASDLALVQCLYHGGEAESCLRSDDYAGTAAHLEMAAEYAADEEERHELELRAQGARSWLPASGSDEVADRRAAVVENVDKQRRARHDGAYVVETDPPAISEPGRFEAPERPAPAPVGEPASPPRAGAPTRRRGTSGKAQAVAVAVALLLVGGGAAVAMSGGGSSSEGGTSTAAVTATADQTTTAAPTTSAPAPKRKKKTRPKPQTSQVSSGGRTYRCPFLMPKGFPSEERLAGLRRELKRVRDKYPNGAPNAVIQYYESTRTKFNTLVTKHNRILRERCEPE